MSIGQIPANNVLIDVSTLSLEEAIFQVLGQRASILETHIKSSQQVVANMSHSLALVNDALEKLKAERDYCFDADATATTILNQTGKVMSELPDVVQTFPGSTSILREAINLVISPHPYPYEIGIGRTVSCQYNTPKADIDALVQYLDTLSNSLSKTQQDASLLSQSLQNIYGNVMDELSNREKGLSDTKSSITNNIKQ